MDGTGPTRQYFGVSDPVSPLLTGLLARCAAKIRMAAARHGLSAVELDEVLQETRIRLWKTHGTGEKIDQLPASYVYQTVASAAIDLIRRRRRGARHQALDDLTERLEARDDLDRDVDQRELGERIWAAVAALPPDRRVAVRMYLNGYNHVEVADRLGWTEARARNLVYRGLADLRAALGEEGVE